MQPAVFLDRDGVLLHDVHYLSRREDRRWYPFAIDAIRLLNRGGFLVFVVTNQGGIALGRYDEAFVKQTHAEMAEDVRGGGARVDGWFYCPHHPRGVVEVLRIDCECRKPKTGMVRQAEERFSIDRARSFVVGDKQGDIALARAIGATGVLVRTGHGEDEEHSEAGSLAPAHAAADLMAATAWILRTAGHPREEP